MSGRLAGKRIVITGAGQGIGRAAAMACATEGAVVTAVDINAAQLDSLAAQSKISETQILDVQVHRAVAWLAARLPAQDGLFNCVGFVHDGTILDCPPVAFDHSFALNVRSMYLMTQAFLPGMIERAKAGGTSSILNMASMASSIKGFPRRFVYGATKAAVIGMTKAIAADYVASGIRCNAVCPGTVDTPSLRQRIANADDPIAAEKAFIARQPMGRLAGVDDIVPQIIYLLSDESRFVTGQAILVDGGVTI
jgi:2-keto-3-deoxy-L-fuconate dehydrogenase